MDGLVPESRLHADQRAGHLVRVEGSTAMRQLVLGIDPGLEGGFAFVTTTGELVAADDLPTIGAGTQHRIDAANFAETVRRHRPDRAIIEQVGARPGQGVASLFRFGQGFGTIIGVLGALAVPIAFVTPAAWKRSYRLAADKEAA